MPRHFGTVLFLIVIFCLVFVVATAAVAQYTIGEVGPDFTLPDLDGNPVHLYDYQNQIIVVNFFATWCPGCNVESLQLQHDIHEAYSEHGVTVLGVDLLESTEVVQAWRDEMELTYPMVIASDWSLFQQFPMAGGIPYNAIFDRNMVLQYAQFGFELNHIIGVIDNLIEANPVNREPSSLCGIKALFR